MADHDPVNHPKHYTSHPSGIECIDITRHMGFNLGNAMKYIWRADLKADAIEDMQKAVWYIHDEIKKRRRAQLEAAIAILKARQREKTNADTVNAAQAAQDNVGNVGADAPVYAERANGGGYAPDGKGVPETAGKDRPVLQQARDKELAEEIVRAKEMVKGNGLVEAAYGKAPIPGDFYAGKLTAPSVTRPERSWPEADVAPGNGTSSGLIETSPGEWSQQPVMLPVLDEEPEPELPFPYGAVS
jgi:hypothetical protein